MENICLDPTDASEMHEKDHVFFTHLTTELIHLLPVLPEKCTAFTTQEIYKLLQKLNRYCELGLDFPKNLKILPYDYPLNLKNLCVTAKASDDGWFGACVLLLEDENEKIGYAKRFVAHGLHKKRIKKWKQFFRDQSLSALILGKDLVENKDSLLPDFKKITKELENLEEGAEVSTNFSLYDPESLAKLNDLCQKTGHRLLLTPLQANIAKSFFPFDDFETGTDSDVLIADLRQTFDVVCETQSPSEIDDLIKTIDPKEVSYR